MGKLTINLREWQAEFYDNMKRFNVLLCHRRAGKTVAAVYMLILEALSCERSRPQMAYAAPEKDQGENVIWAYLKEFLREMEGVVFKETKKEVHFPHNKAVIRVVGLKNLESLRGLYWDLIVIDEYSDVAPDAWGTVIYPALTDRQGRAIIMGTPKGADHFHDLFVRASNDESGTWHAKKLTVYDTKIFSEQEIEDMKKELTTAQFAQEMLVDPFADFSNRYYLELMSRAQEQGRLGEYGYNPKLPVYTAWDLGRDGTAIWFAQKQGKKIYLIDYWQKEQALDEEAIQVVLNKGYIYKEHFLPHDAASKHISSQYSTFEKCRGLGMRVKVLPRDGGAGYVSRGIQMVQSAMINCHFDKVKAYKGIECLRNYQAKIDYQKGIMLDKPVHDKFSHGSDAFRYLIQGLSLDRSEDLSEQKFEFDNKYNFLDVI